MPYRCVHCAAIYADASPEVLNGCVCGSRFFFYLKEEKLQQLTQKQEPAPEFSDEEKARMEEEVREITGLQDQPETPVFLDFESVKVLKPGKYLIDVEKLLGRSKKPQIYQLEDGKYIVDLSPLLK